MVVKVSFHPSGWCFLTAWICNNKVDRSGPRGQDSRRTDAPDCRTVPKGQVRYLRLDRDDAHQKEVQGLFSEKYERHKQKPRLAEF